MAKGSWRRRGLKFGAKVDVNLDGKDTFKSGFDVIGIWPKYCIRFRRCFQCHLEGKVQCAPRFREKVIV